MMPALWLLQSRCIHRCRGHSVFSGRPARPRRVSPGFSTGSATPSAPATTAIVPRRRTFIGSSDTSSFMASATQSRWAPTELREFLTSLAVDGKVAASTQNQALSGLLFLYREVLGVELPWLDDVVRAKRPQYLPVVLTRDEVRAVLQRLDGVPRPNQILIRDGKGHKDRVTMLPASVKSGVEPPIERVTEETQA